METADIKARFGIVGNDEKLNQAISTAVQVAPIMLSVLIIGESGSGKEVFPQIIHAFSQRKHNPYVAVNCGAIPEGTIDSELFGHEKGSFTGALADRRGYFEEANGGTIFLDEIGELPLQTQAKLLRILEKGEYMKVGSSVVKKTDVRIVAATNVDLEKAIAEGRFREDLFYRLNGIMIRIPPLRQRKDDIPLLFSKFVGDFAAKNRIPAPRLTPEAKLALCDYSWPGNVRQLKNIAEQITVLTKNREIDIDEVERFIPKPETSVSTVPFFGDGGETFKNEREILYKVLFEMRKDMAEMKKMLLTLMNGHATPTDLDAQYPSIITSQDGAILSADTIHLSPRKPDPFHSSFNAAASNDADSQRILTDDDLVPNDLSLDMNEKDTIIKALNKHGGRRKATAKELGISERTLYRKIHDYDINIK